jgi:hypothetical protein
MFRIAFVAGLLALGLATVPAAAGPAQKSALSAGVSDVTAQARPRLRVYPGGRLLYRDCDFKLVQQMRPGGPVIVPWQRCWWVRG